MERVVIRRWGVAGVLCVLCLCSEAQSDKKSFVFNNERWSVALRSVVEGFDLYLSYDPDLVKEDTRVTATYRDETLDEILHALLGEQYDFEIIQDYVVITAIITKPVPPGPQRTLTVPQQVTVYDTVKVEQYITRYDTQTIKQYEIVYDTVIVEKLEHVYDTTYVELKNRSEPHKLQFVPYIGPGIWIRSSPSLQKDMIYTGLNAGVSAIYNWEKFQISLGVAYSFLISNVKYYASTITTDVRIDTVSTYYIIENGEQVPVYVTDSTTITTVSGQTVDRYNTIQFFSANFLAGYHKGFEKLIIGAEVGVSLDWIIKSDEVVLWNGEYDPDGGKLDYHAPLWHTTVQFPLLFKKAHSYVTPYGQIGLNPDFRDLGSIHRYRAGIKIGMAF